jgi:hypothetical protein
MLQLVRQKPGIVWIAKIHVFYKVDGISDGDTSAVNRVYVCGISYGMKIDRLESLNRIYGSFVQRVNITPSLLL